MKSCSKCFRQFNEEESADYNPAMELGDIFLQRPLGSNDADFCPECREELGKLNLLGFRE